MAKRSILVVALAALVALPALSFANPESFTVKLTQKGSLSAPAGWKLMCNDRSSTCYFTDEQSVTGFCIRTDSSKNSVQRKLDVDLGAYPVVTWRWKVKELPVNGDCRSCETDDQAAQLYIVFEGKDVLGYIWDTNAPVGEGAEYSIPMLQDVKTVVVKSGHADKDEWVTLTRNVREDYAKVFGKEPPSKVIGIRFQANSQHTDSIAEACLEKVEFKKGI